jgi:hypothetical protein
MIITIDISELVSVRRIDAVSIPTLPLESLSRCCPETHGIDGDPTDDDYPPSTQRTNQLIEL